MTVVVVGHGWGRPGSRAGAWRAGSVPRAMTPEPFYYRPLSSRNSHLTVAGRGARGRDVGHGHITEPGPRDAAGRLDDHVGGGLGGVVGGLGQAAGVGVGGGDDAGV